MLKDTATKLKWHRAQVRRVATYLAVFVLVLAAYLFGYYQSPANISKEDRENVALYAEALDAVKEGYVDREALDSKKQAYGAIKGMLDSLGDDGHTRFLTPKEVQKTRDRLSSTYVGIGIQLDGRDGDTVVKAPKDGSPAKEAGLKSGDVLIAVDGESVQGEKIEEIGDKVRGPEGTQVKLTVLRDGDEREFAMKRAELQAPTVSWSLVPDSNVAHLRLVSFSENSSEELKGAISEAQEAGAERFVLDLRDNAGGLVDQAKEVAAQFLPSGSEIFVRREADGERQKPTTVPDDNEPLEDPLVVLVNKGSASSAEIVAGALRDNDRATIVGETTFGTGTVLSEYDLSDGSAILLGTAEWLTPKGDFIRGAGITPDVEAKLEEGQEPRTPDETEGLSREEIFSEDAQLESAFEAVQSE